MAESDLAAFRGDVALDYWPKVEPAEVVVLKGRASTARATAETRAARASCACDTRSPAGGARTRLRRSIGSDEALRPDMARVGKSGLRCASKGAEALLCGKDAEVPPSWHPCLTCALKGLLLLPPALLWRRPCSR